MPASHEKDLLMLSATAERMRDFVRKTKVVGDCILFSDTGPNGYGRISISNTFVYAHRLVFVRSVGTPLPGLVVRHKCRNRNCVALAHLESGTTLDNVHDKYRDGTMRAPSHGEKHSWAVVTQEQVRAAYMAYAKGGVSFAAVGAKFGLSKSAVEAIVRRVNWKEATADLPEIPRDKVSGKKRGKDVNTAILKEEHIGPIRKALGLNGSIASCRKLAALYGVAWQTIYSIKRGDTWQHVN